MSYVDETGFHRTSRADILANLQAGMESIYPGGDFSEGSPDGQALAMYADQIDAATALLEATYNARGPSGATGAALARLVQINGVKKKAPAASTGTVTLTGTTGTLIPAGSLVGNVADPTAIYATDADVTLKGGTGTAAVTSTKTGPVPGGAGDLTKILTVIPGWTGVTNAADVSLGNDGETDPELRIRRAASVALPSQGILDGLEAALLQLPNVTQARVRENPEDVTATLADGGPLVAHAIEAMVIGGDPVAIAETIWLKRSLGVTMVGGHVETVVDSQGVSHAINFDIPGAGIIDVPIYVEVHTAAPLSGGDQTTVAQAIEHRGSGLLVINGEALPGSQMGEDVAVSDVYDAITALKLTTLPTLKVSKIFIGTAPGPTLETPIAIAFDEIATWSNANVTFAHP